MRPPPPSKRPMMLLFWLARPSIYQGCPGNRIPGASGTPTQQPRRDKKKRAIAKVDTATNTSTSGTSIHRSDIFILPFANFSSNFHELLHKANECTHYCSTPYLWYPIWRSLRLSMEVNINSIDAKSVTIGPPT